MTTTKVLKTSEEFFKEFKNYSLEKRLNDSNKVLSKYPRKIPVLVNSSKDIDLRQHKYLVPDDLCISEFMQVIRSKINLNKSEALFITLEDGTMISMSKIMKQVYKDSKNEDNFLYLYIMKETTFG